MKKRNKLIFIVLCVACCIFPLVSYPFAGNQDAESEESSKEWPSFFNENGSWNSAFLEEAGDYFTYNFGFRQQLVTANAAIKSTVFQTSDQDNVVLGKNGWLYYGSSMDDYIGEETLNDLQAAQVVTNLELLQSTLAETYGIDFVFTISPNKNSLYPENMPSRYHANAETRNSTRLRALLAESDVNFVDLYDLFEAQDEVLYHATDSHWNNQGAALVNEALMTALGRDSYDYSTCAYEVRNDFTGDLFEMLYPTVEGTEEEVYYDKERDYEYVYEIDSTYDPEIETVNDSADGSVVMFRDSFGNSLLPFVADEFGEGYFSRTNPFAVYEAVEREADVVIAEIVERDLTDLQEAAPILASSDATGVFYAQGISSPLEVEEAGEATMEKEEVPAGISSYVKMSGQLDPDLIGEDTITYISLYDEETGYWYLYQVYYTAESAADKSLAAYGYTVYFEEPSLDGTYTVSVIMQNGDEVVRSGELGQFVAGADTEEEE